MWRSGQALRPYFEDVRLVVRLKESIPELNGFKIVDEDKLDFVHFPIKDCGITGNLNCAESSCQSNCSLIFITFN